MLFDRYRKAKRPDDATRPPTDLPKSAGFAGAFFRKLPHFTKRAWQSHHHHQQQKRQDSGVSMVVAAPRQSASLPNIHHYGMDNKMNDPHPPPTPDQFTLEEKHLDNYDDGEQQAHPDTGKRPKPSATASTPALRGGLSPAPPKRQLKQQQQPQHPRLQKRHSIEHTRSSSFSSSAAQPAKRVRSCQDKSCGNITDGVTRLSVTDNDAQDQNERLQSTVVPLGSQSHQLPSSQANKRPLPRAHSLSSSPHGNKASLREIKGRPLLPDQLSAMLSNNHMDLILIDVRNLMEYQRHRIRGSINVNLPSLLIKRYQRGTVSNFNLENFITTAEGRKHYAQWREQQKRNQGQQQQSSVSAPVASILEQKAAEAALRMQKRTSLFLGTVWVIYDDDMSETQRTSPAWTLLSVLERALQTQPGAHEVVYLTGGFRAFESGHSEHVIEGPEEDDGDPIHDHKDARRPSEQQQQDCSFNVETPRRSASYTIGSSDKNNLSRRTSLFSLDTQAARANNANALARRANRRSEAAAAKANSSTSNLTLNASAANISSNIPDEGVAVLGDSLSIHSNYTSKNTMATLSNTTDGLLGPPQLLQAPSATTSTSSSSPLARVLEDDDELPVTDASPRTESDFDFIISEIIPGFLYVGPEIETPEQAGELHARRIRRVLNMAEECEDALLQDTMIYRKISARDTVEMKNIDWVMMEAVGFIEDAKRKHEPIYVHCKAGKSRSVTAILAYLVTSERWTLKQAYRHVIKARPNMSPNIGFIAELMKMEGRVHGRVSSFMESDWQSTAMPSPEFTRELKQLELAWQQSPKASNQD
ncbi:hypothetical protein BCR43DRAFT_482834 [Syncephalastrum racemosum]|uniref:protein-tyrosine-phosphatase n=1 Tax=Syncephalastrum racemosum TaxID=13706 RepID=A0A1X2HUD4_SYNRA|nr:hypothetical protein BCR43DRAFT_482834 [Syncephalastrum racemosum]